MLGRLANLLPHKHRLLGSSRSLTWTPLTPFRATARWAPALFHTMATLQKAIVRSLPGEPNMTITLVVGGKQRNMDRPKDELLEKPLGRLQKSAAPQVDRQQKRKQQQQQQGDGKREPLTAAGTAAAAQAPFVGLHEGPSSDHPVLDAAAVTNEEAWRQGRLLRVGEIQYQVELNPPLLDRVELHARPFVGIPLMPVVQLHFAEEEACQWQWFRQRDGGSPWEPLPGATSRRYLPRPEDAGCCLRVECTPARRGDPDVAAAQGEAGLLLLGAPGAAQCGPVAVPPAPAAAAARHTLTQQPTASPELRVVTYNILADQYAATETAKNVIFSHCPPQFLDPDYRRPLVLSELLGFRADIMCLQEVDEKAFSAYLEPQLAAEGYRGVYTNKAGKAGFSVREGSATFFHTSRFNLLQHRSLTLKHLFPAQPGEVAKYGDVFADMLRSSPALQHALQRIATVAQISLLAPVQPGDRALCVLNTHLFFHYMAPHIRTMHVWAMVQEAHQLIESALADADLARQLGGQRPSLLFCGDLNSDLNDGIPGAIELLSKGRVPAEFWDWWYGAEFKWEKGEDAEGQQDGEGGAAGAGNGAAAGAGNEAAAAAAGGGSNVGGSTAAAQQQQAAPAAAAATLSSSDEFGEVAKQVHSAVEHVRPPGSPTGHSSPGAGSRQQFVAGVDLQIPFRLQSADGLRTPFTNYVKGYQGLLDYIWYDPSALEVVREVPLPSLEEMGGAEGYLPSQRFPSDHLPVVFDLRFRAEAAAGGSSGAAASGSSSGRGAAGAAAGAAGGDGSDADVAAAAAAAAAAGNVVPAAMYNVGAAAEALAQDKVLALPTDTLYGLAACANSSAAVAHIYATKQRGDHKPLAICVADVHEVARYGDTQHLPKGLLEDLLPGPVTLLLSRLPDAPLAAELNPGVGAIGIRIPEAPFIRAVCRQHRSALALTSANISGGMSSIAVGEFQELWPACSLVFDGGRLDAGRSGSTVVDLTRPGEFVIGRRGSGFARTMQLLQEKHGLRHVL